MRAPRRLRSLFAVTFLLCIRRRAAAQTTQPSAQLARNLMGQSNGRRPIRSMSAWRWIDADPMEVADDLTSA